MLWRWGLAVLNNCNSVISILKVCVLSLYFTIFTIKIGNIASIVFLCVVLVDKSSNDLSSTLHKHRSLKFNPVIAYVNTDLIVIFPPCFVVVLRLICLSLPNKESIYYLLAYLSLLAKFYILCQMAERITCAQSQ